MAGKIVSGDLVGTNQSSTNLFNLIALALVEIYILYSSIRLRQWILIQIFSIGSDLSWSRQRPGQDLDSRSRSRSRWEIQSACWTWEDIVGRGGSNRECHDFGRRRRCPRPHLRKSKVAGGEDFSTGWNSLDFYPVWLFVPGLDWLFSNHHCKTLGKYV